MSTFDVSVGAIEVNTTECPIICYEQFVSGEEYGILTITAPKLDPNTKREVFLRVNADASGSMEGPKLTYVKECLCKLMNMLLGYKKTYPKFTFYVSIVAFDTRLFTISPIVVISEDTVPLLINQINMIREGGGTAFDNPFKDARVQFDTFKIDYTDATILHLFLSDGEVNSGIDNKEELYKLLHKSHVPVAVVGLCDGHDVETMIGLASSDTSVYIYVVDPESFGLLISDFLSNMFGVVKDVTIHRCRHNEESSNNQCLYDFRNDWESSLYIPVLTSEQRRIFYVKGNNEPITVSYTYNDKTETIVVSSNTIDMNINYKIAIWRLECIKMMRKTIEYIDAKYKLSIQYDCVGCTEDTFTEDTFTEDTGDGCDYIGDCVSPKNVMLEQAVKDAIQKLVDFITEHSLQDDALMNQLCKDLEICLKALFAPHNIAKAFVSARLLSQAEQKCVTISDTRVLDNLTQRHVTGLYNDNFTPFSRTCTSDSTPSCGDIMRSLS